MELSIIERNSYINTVIRYYNMVAGINLQYKTPTTREAVDKALVKAQNLDELRSYIKERVRQAKDAGKKPAHLKDLCDQFCISNAGPVFKTLTLTTPTTTAPSQFITTDPEPAKPSTVNSEPATTSVRSTGVEPAMEVLSKVITDLLAQTKLDEVEKSISERLEKKVTDFIYQNYGPITRNVTLTINNNKSVTLKGTTHVCFNKALNNVALGIPTFLVGPAGVGKNYMCKQIADALGLDFYFTNAVTQEYQLKGFTDAMGNYRASQFYKAVSGGGLFLFDEMDASIPETLIIINDAIANGYVDFPAPIGCVKAHPNFRVVAAGNTAGHGADYDYVGRNQLDAASLDRFALLFMDYDPKIEESIAGGDKELLGFFRAYRKACKDKGIRTITSYRALTRLVQLKDNPAYTLPELLRSALTKALEKPDLIAIRNDLSGFGKYSSAFNTLVNDMK